MRSLAEIGTFLAADDTRVAPVELADAYLAVGEEILENWLRAHDRTPTQGTHEGFRLLALHRQAAKGDPSFNACRETCRELVYHYNVIRAAPAGGAAERAKMMRFVLNHLHLFISGKLEMAGLGEFCCASRSLRTETA